MIRIEHTNLTYLWFAETYKDNILATGMGVCLGPFQSHLCWINLPERWEPLQGKQYILFRNTQLSLSKQDILSVIPSIQHAPLMALQL